MTSIGSNGFRVLKDLAFSDAPRQLATLLCEHFKATRSKITKRYRFHSAVQQHGQSIADFVLKLKKLAVSLRMDSYMMIYAIILFVDYVHNMSSRNSCQETLPSKKQ